MCRSVMDVEDLALVWCVIAAPRILLLYQKRLGDVLLSSDKSQKQPWFDINHQECSSGMLIPTTYYNECVNTFTEKIVRYRYFGEVKVF